MSSEIITLGLTQPEGPDPRIAAHTRRLARFDLRLLTIAPHIFGEERRIYAPTSGDNALADALYLQQHPNEDIAVKRGDIGDFLLRQANGQAYETHGLHAIAVENKVVAQYLLPFLSAGFNTLRYNGIILLDDTHFTAKDRGRIVSGLKGLDMHVAELGAPGDGYIVGRKCRTDSP